MLDTAAYRRAAEHFLELALQPSTASITVSARYREAARLIDELCSDLDACREGLRDRFAMAALTGLITNATPVPHLARKLAAGSYEMADAMLAERTRTVPQDAGREGAGDRQ